MHIQLDRFPPNFFWIGPGFRLQSVLEKPAAIPMTAAAGFSGPILSFRSATLVDMLSYSY